MMEWLANPELWVAFLTLTALEIVLGIDNIIFISILVGRLPKEQQPKARFFGLALAMGTRILLLLSITWVMRLTADLFTVLDQGISQSRQHVAGETVQHGVPHGASGPSSMDSLRFQQPGVWGRKVTWAHIVEDGDRVELYRPLKVDPKVARRQRFKRQGKGRTGLFANRKSGVAAGY